MVMNNIKKVMLALDFEEQAREENNYEELEVLADSVQQALDIASEELQLPLDRLDYNILQKGTGGMFGFGRLPYKVSVRQMEDDTRWDDLEDLNVSVGGGGAGAADGDIEINRDAKVIVRVYKTGVVIKVIPPAGKGKAPTMELAKDRINKAGIQNYDQKAVEIAIKTPNGEPIKIGEWIPKPEADSTLAVEVAADEMKAYVTVTPPRPGGRHITIDEVKKALSASGVVFGFKDEDVQKALDNDKYNQMIVAAEGQKPKNGEDAYIDYKVRIEKKVEFKEDESGRVDFLAKDLVENVVQGQILAELIPAERGTPGKTVTGRIMPTEDGQPTTLQPGKGTILSDDGMRLLAERNGQVVYKSGKLQVEEVYTVPGDVGLDTGNIMFLGSVQVRGGVTDNMEVKAAGNIEVGGSVQKAHLEAEGDVIIRQGIQGRDGAMIESTTGSIMAKFVQNARLSCEKDVLVSEAIMHSNVDTGGRIVCTGKRAQIVGGEIMAGTEVRVKQLGATSNTPTAITVGTNPKILKQIKQLDEIQKSAEEKMAKVEQNIRTLSMQKSSMRGKFPPDKEEMLVKMMSFKEKLEERLSEAEGEKEQLHEYMSALASNGKVHVEKTLFPGVTIEINGARFVVKDEYNHVTLAEEKGNIKILPYEEPDAETKKLTDKRRRRR